MDKQEIEEIKECSRISKLQLEHYKKIEETVRDMYAALVEEKEKIVTNGGKEFLELEIKETYRSLIEHGVILGRMESLINFYENMLKGIK